MPFTYYHFANITGSGTYVGTVLSSVNQLDSWFGEGNDRWFVDGELDPRIVGTGTEDYFNDGWNMRLQAGLRRGTTIMESPHSVAGARITAYRWHIDDPIPFTTSLVANIERRSFVAVDGEEHPFLFRPDLYSSVAFFYHDGVFVPPAGSRFWDFPAAPQRAPGEEVWIETPAMLATAAHSSDLSLSTGRCIQCFHERPLVVRSPPADCAVGSWLRFPVNATPGLWIVQLRVVKRPDGVVWNVTVAQPDFRSQLVDGFDRIRYPAQVPQNYPENVDVGTVVDLNLGRVNVTQRGVMWVTLSRVGHDPASDGCGLSIEGFYIRKLRIADQAGWVQNYTQAAALRDAAKERAVRADVGALSGAVAAYFTAHGQYPPSLAALGDGLPVLDPWLQRYEYRVPGNQNVGDFDVYSRHGDSQDPAGWVGNWAAKGTGPWRVPGGYEAEQWDVVSASPASIHTTPQVIASKSEGLTSNGTILFIGANATAQSVTLRLPPVAEAGGAPGAFRCVLLFFTAWDYGDFDWSVAAGSARQQRGGGAGGYVRGTSRLHGRGAQRANATVRVPDARTAPLLTVTTTGRGEFAGGYRVGLDAVVWEAA